MLLRIYTRGIGSQKGDIKNVYDSFPKLFGNYKTKKNTVVISDMRKYYPDVAARITSEKWHELFPIEKSYKREEIAEILSNVLNEMIGIGENIDEDDF